MNKITKIAYWVATLWLALGMVSTGIVQILNLEAKMDYIVRLGFPAYFLPLLGVWKILGVVAVLVPRLPLLKEWAYAGFFFMMSGAVYCHLAAGSPASEVFPSILLLALTVMSWALRPADRKLAAAPAKILTVA